MEQNSSEINNYVNNSKNEISPVSKMKILTAEKAKKDSQYWIEHFKFKQNLINGLEFLKNEKPEKFQKISQISTFSKEQDILCDNLFKLKKITSYSRLKLGENFNEMKIIENKEETMKKKFKEILEDNLEKIKEIEKTSEEIDVQKQLLNNLQENFETVKSNISEMKTLNSTNIDNLCNKYSEENKDLNNISKLYNVFSNITKYRVLDIQKDENDPDTKIVKGYMLNSKNGNIINYDIKIKNNESIETKAMKIFNFWKNLIDFNNKDNSN